MDMDMGMGIVIPPFHSTRGTQTERVVTVETECQTVKGGVIFSERENKLLKEIERLNLELRFERNRNKKSIFMKEEREDSIPTRSFEDMSISVRNRGIKRKYGELSGGNDEKEEEKEKEKER